MKKTMMVLSLCLMSVIGFANNRQIRKLKKIAASESRHSEVADALAKKC